MYLNCIIQSAVIVPQLFSKVNTKQMKFFNFVNNTNLCSENHAKSRCLAHLAKFILDHDWIELGRSLHYLEDVCTPVHVQYEDSSDAVFKLPIHVEFEREFDEFLKSTNCNFDRPKKSQNIEHFLNAIALKSAELYHDYKNLHSEKQQKNEIFGKVLNNAVTFGCALAQFALNDCHFVREIFCNTKSVGYILDNKILAPTTDNCRFRVASTKSFAIFFKAGIGRNFIFTERRKFPEF